MFTRAIIDFDDTLFDAKRFKEDIAAVFAGFGVGPQIFWESYKEARDSSDGKSTYTFERHLRIINKDYVFIDIEEAKQRLEALLEDKAQYIFPDAIDFLQSLKERQVELLLLSLGEENFQSKKLEKTGLGPFFKNIFLVNDSKLNVLNKILDQSVQVNIFVNDKIKETKEVSRHYPNVIPILKTRSDVPLSEYQNSGLPYFQTLSEILNYLTNVTLRNTNRYEYTNS